MIHVLFFHKNNKSKKKTFQQHFSGFFIGGASYDIRFYCKMSSIIKKKECLCSHFRNLFLIACLWILYVRSFFIKDRTYFVVFYFLPFMTTLFIFLTYIFPDIFTGFSAFYFHMYLGSQFIIYDEIGSRISHNFINTPDSIFSHQNLQHFLNHRNVVVRHISFTAISNIIIGKTAMTATGRATLVVGAFTGSAWLYNNYRDREAAEARAQADRSAADARAQADRSAADLQQEKARAYQNYQDARHSYEKKRFHYRDHKPQWDEDTWYDWKKSK